MCYFITLIAPTNDAPAIRDVLSRHGRKAEPIDNPSIRKVLKAGERQFLTNGGQCDCASVLVSRGETSESREASAARETARMKRLGWSAAKIARAHDSRGESKARSHGGNPDSLQLWSAVLADLAQSLKLPSAGLLVKYYSGVVADEKFSASRREVAKGAGLDEHLCDLKEGEATMFRLR